MASRWLRGLCLALLCTLATWVHAAPKVLLVGMDGAQYEKMQALQLPNLARLNVTRAYTGGVNGTSSAQPTVSGPGWSTILTGVWMNKHQVTSNSSGLANPQYPSLFKRIRDARPNAYIASVTDWAAINQQFFTNDVAGNNFNASGWTDAAVADKVVELLKTTPADFIFLHFDDPDHAGHDSGFGTAYNDALRNTDARLGRLLDTVQQRQAQTGDDWLVLVTTDHGREAPLGYNHGSQTTSEKTIFIASNKPMNAEFTQFVSSVPNQDFGGLYGYAPQTWIAPTVLRHLGIEPKMEWLLDGAPLLGAEPVRKLMPATSASQTFSWYSLQSGMVDIARNGSVIASLPTMQQGYLDSAAPEGSRDYTLTLNGTPISLRLGSAAIRTTLDWDATRSYFFLKDGSYVRYNQTLDRADSGYPQPVTDGTWPGLAAYKDLLVGGFSKDASTAYFFLSDGRYLRYNKSSDKVDAGYPKAIDNGSWPGLGAYATQIAATLRWTGSKVQIFLKDGRYLRYDLTADKVDTGYPKAVNDSSWPGLGAYATQIAATLKWDDTRAYFFLKDGRYIRYSITSDRADAGYPQAITASNWPGLLPQ